MKLCLGKSLILTWLLYNIHIKKNNEIMPWKKFNSNMAISVEYDLQY